MTDVRSPSWAHRLSGKSILAAGLHVLGLAIALPGVLVAVLMLDDWTRLATDWRDLLLGPKSGLGWLGLTTFAVALLVYFCLALLARRVRLSQPIRVPTT